MSPTRGDPVSCWRCEKTTDTTTAAVGEDTAPAPGDVSICFYCGELAVFTGRGLETRQPTDAERAEILADPGVVIARGTVLAHIAGDR
jgi:hypothetical protein